MHRIAPFLLALALAAGCGDEKGPVIVEESAQALITHGPFNCNGVLPERGYVELGGFAGQCERWRGDFNTGSSHIGLAVTPSFAVKTARISLGYRPRVLGTVAIICQHAADGPSYAPCGSGAGHLTVFLDDQNGHTSVSSLSFIPAAVVIGYTAQCPNSADYHEAQLGYPYPYPRPPANDSYPAALSWTSCGYAADGSGLQAWMATDGAGHPINLPTTSGFDVECTIDPAQPPVAPGAPASTVVAVYGC